MLSIFCVTVKPYTKLITEGVSFENLVKPFLGHERDRNWKIKWPRNIHPFSIGLYIHISVYLSNIHLHTHSASALGTEISKSGGGDCSSCCADLLRYMIGMEIDLPKEPANSLPPKFRIVQVHTNFTLLHHELCIFETEEAKIKTTKFWYQLYKSDGLSVVWKIWDKKFHIS